jgi:hypothetical protein
MTSEPVEMTWQAHLEQLDTYIKSKETSTFKEQHFDVDAVEWGKWREAHLDLKAT